MDDIQLSFADISLYNNIAIVKIHFAVELNSVKTCQLLDAIEEKLRGNYGVLSNRVNEYSTVPLDVANEVNSRARFVALAIVPNAKHSKITFEIEKKLIEREVDYFSDKQAAMQWLERQL